MYADCALAAGVIAGIVIGCIAFIFFFIVVGVCVRRRRLTYVRVTEVSQHFFFFAARLSFVFVSDNFLISLMIDEDEDDNSYVAMALHFGVRLTC
jgi:hypothetical protein